MGIINHYAVQFECLKLYTPRKFGLYKKRKKRERGDYGGNATTDAGARVGTGQLYPVKRKKLMMN